METIDPKWIRVSSILSMLPTKDDEGKWGYPIQRLDQDMLARKAELGSSVHAAIASHVKKEFAPLTDKEQGYLDSFLKWDHSINLDPRDVELRLYSDTLGLTGCIDMIGKVNHNGLYSLIDFKCTASPDPVKWPIQGAFYKLLADLNGISLDETCLFVQLDPKGDFPKVHEYHITKELTSIAMSMYNTYLYLTKR